MSARRRITSRWHRHGRISWFLGKGDRRTPWWKTRYRTRFRRDEISFGPLFIRISPKKKATA